MKQIYYTQCPIGYGLGASNGFQIKRRSPDYPISGDFRQLGLRAFVAGSRTLAPPALRYRRNEQGEAEVAWLNPRSHEYETERGLWGRPGGHFAHGLVLSDDELEALGNWPAGLYDQPFWTRSDPSPSRGEPPEPLDLTAANLCFTPGFEAFSSLAEADHHHLATLLTALAVVVREERTLFLVDDPGRLVSWISLLTLAFPASWRAALTFSTYHDRPEELPGFRLQGTIPAVRPNRPALLSQGIVADLASGTCEPHIEPAPWALTLADFLTRRSDDDRRAWEDTTRRALLVRERAGSGWIWGDESLNLLYRFDRLTRAPGPPSTDPEGWRWLAEASRWAAKHGLAEEIVPARPPAWWSSPAITTPGGIEALRTHLSLPAAWGLEGVAPAWGETVAYSVRDQDRTERHRMVGQVLETAPAPSRPGFVRALIAALPPPEAAETLLWLEEHPACDRALLLPLGVRGAVDDAIDRRDPRRLRDLIAQAFDLPGALPAVLDALAVAAKSRPSSFDELAGLLARALETARRQVIADVLRWGLRQGEDAPQWLGKYLRRSFAVPTNQEAWRALDKLVPRSRKREFARVVLAVARDRKLPDEAFRWAVEEVLLVLPEDDRPVDPSWPAEYVDRTRSGLDLLKRLFTKEYRALGVNRWLEQARQQGALSPAQVERIADCERYARALRAGDARSLIDTRLPAVPDEDRGAMLAQILRHVGDSPGDPLNLALDSCRDAWPGAFAPGQAGLAGIGRVLADRLRDWRDEPPVWFDRLVRILERLGLTGPSGCGFEPDSLAAVILAETTNLHGPDFQPWSLRQFLLQHETAWRILAADVRREVAELSIAARLDCLERWDRSLVKGMHTSRFFEIWLNVCDGPTLAAVVAARALDLRTLGALPWWDHPRYDDACNDLCDAFARLAPMAPLPEESLSAVQAWFRASRRSPRPDEPDHREDALSAEGPADLEKQRVEEQRVSRTGATRWRCLEAITALHRAGIGADSRQLIVRSWEKELPLGELEVLDRYRLLAWVIRRVESLEIERLATWLVRCGLTDADRVSAWADELEGLAEVPGTVKLERSAMVGELRNEMKTVVRELRDRSRKSAGSNSP